ncbi:MAG: Uma2 family endonuclease [Desulfobacteraceae bacterium]|nr:Uma2 family endonuclease [Desulfobacteraceae bacterium]
MFLSWFAENIEKLKNPAPDISIIADVENPEKPRGTFSVLEEGVKPFFILEVVSPRYRKADTDKKPVIYRKAGVLEYIIADSGLKNNEISYTIQGYRLIGNRYVKIGPDPEGIPTD